MKRNDVVYYVGYLIVFIMLGIWMLIWALDAILFREALLLWFLSAGILLMIIGGGNLSGRRASNVQLGAGLLITAFILIMLAMTSNLIGGFVGASIGIILIGIIGLILLFRNIKLEA